MKKWLFNPFVYIAGGKALLYGWLVMVATAVIAYYSHTHFDGAIDMHMGKETTLAVYFIEQFVDWSCLVLFFYAGGRLFSRTSFRFVDIAGTTALARWPALVSAIIGFGIQSPNTDSIEKMVASITPVMVVLSLVSVVFIIWMIALLYNAFAISCNIKGSKSAIVFIATLLIAEVCSHLLLHSIYTHF